MPTESNAKDKPKTNFGLGDHRGILVDIPSSSLLGDSLHSIQTPSARRLQCNNPEVKDKYNWLLESYCRVHKIADKIAVVASQDSVCRSVIKPQLKAIDRVLGEGMQHAEK